MMSRVYLFGLIFLVLTGSAFANRQIDDLLVNIGGRTRAFVQQTDDIGNQVLDAEKELTVGDVQASVDEELESSIASDKDTSELLDIFAEMPTEEVIEYAKSRSAMEEEQVDKDTFRLKFFLNPKSITVEKEAKLEKEDQNVEEKKKLLKNANSKVNSILREIASNSDISFDEASKKLASARVEQINFRQQFGQAQAQRRVAAAELNALYKELTLTITVKKSTGAVRLRLRRQGRKGRPYYH